MSNERKEGIRRRKQEEEEKEGGTQGRKTGRNIGKSWKEEKDGENDLTFP